MVITICFTQSPLKYYKSKNMMGARYKLSEIEEPSLILTFVHRFKG